jgi:hypothetical protein
MNGTIFNLVEGKEVSAWMADIAFVVHSSVYIPRKV